MLTAAHYLGNAALGSGEPQAAGYRHYTSRGAERTGTLFVPAETQLRYQLSASEGERIREGTGTERKKRKMEQRIKEEQNGSKRGKRSS